MEYRIRHMIERDAQGVSDLFVLTYGDTYDIPAVYFPKQELELDQTGQVYSFVAVDESDKVVGHYGITVDGLSTVGEGGEAAVHPDHRGQKLLEKMRSFAELFVAEKGLSGLFFEPVTVHTFSQHANEADQAKVCGINLGVSPRGTQYAGIDADTSSQRVSMVLYFKPLAEIPKRELTLPQSDSDFLRSILANIQLPYLEIATHNDSQQGLHQLNEDDIHGFASARVIRIGQDSYDWILSVLSNFLDKEKGETFFLDLPLCGGNIDGLVSQLKAQGFRCLGLVPEFNFDGPVVRYAYLTEKYDQSKIRLLSPFAKELLNRILS